MIYLFIFFINLLQLSNLDDVAKYSANGVNAQLVQNVNNPKGTFYAELLDDKLITDSLAVECRYLIKLSDRESSKEFDFSIEVWRHHTQQELESSLKILEQVRYDSFYEKPPKVYLLNNLDIYIISTWGAVYRNDIYKIRDMLKSQFEFKIL
jgi:hypothetical protein